MNIESNLASNAHFLAGVIYTMMGFFSLSLNKKSINKVFFFLCQALAIWCISFFIMMNASNEEFALLAVKFSGVGWGIFYSILFHCFYLLANAEKKVGKRFYLMVYTPAVLTLIINFLPIYDHSELCVIWTKSGFAPSENRVLFMAFFNVYAFTFFFLALKTAISWHKNSVEKKWKITSRNIFFSYIFTAALIIYINLVANSFIEFEGIRYIPVLMLIFVGSLFYLLMKDKIMHPKDEINTSEMINERRRLGIFRITGYSYLLLAFLTLIFNYRQGVHYMEHQVLVSIIIFFVGTIHFVINRFLKRKRDQYYLLSAISVITILFITFRYASYGGLTIWVIFLYYIISSAIFERTVYAYLISFVLVLSQGLYWILNPELDVILDWSDYLSRMIIILVLTALILHINRMYKDRIKETDREIEVQLMTSELSAKIIEINIENINDVVSSSLGILAKTFYCKNAYVYFRDKDDTYIRDRKPNDDFHLKFFSEGSNVYQDDLKVEAPLINLGLIDMERIESGEMQSLANVKKSNLIQEVRDYFLNSDLIGFHAIPVVLDDYAQMIILFEFKKQEALRELKRYHKTILNLSSLSLRKIQYDVKLYNSATYDEITKIKNRSSFSVTVNEFIENNLDIKSSLLCINIDSFNEINDAFGHNIGDVVLRKLAQVLESEAREEDCVARFGGDEFVVFMPGMYERDKVTQKIKNILKVFEKPITIDIYEYKLNISVGVSRYPQDGKNADLLIKNAAIAMHESKKMGKMKYYFCNMLDKEKIFKKGIYTSKLINAIEKDELRLAFQPQMSLKTNELIGAEALIRWHSKDFGIVPPNKFVPILEHTGMIVKVGDWVIEQSARQQAKMFDMGLKKFRMSVNLSAVQFQDSLLTDKISNLLDKWNIDPDYFEFEITESVATNYDTLLLEQFEDIHSTGCSIALDDFGVEFSSLNRLQILPIDRLKIDKNFIDGIGIDEKKESITKVIIKLAKALQVDCIAEGVETEEQEAFLRDSGCDEIQGYYYSRPLAPEDFEDFVRNQ